MAELVDIDFVSELYSRLYTWIRTTGKCFPGGWSYCRAANRALGFLDDLSIEYTIDKSKVWFTFLNFKSDPIDFWQIQGGPFIEEYYYIRNLAFIPYSLRLSLSEEIPFMMMLEGLGYTYKGSLDNVTKIEKKNAN